jgi:hypothetical protein
MEIAVQPQEFSPQMIGPSGSVCGKARLRCALSRSDHEVQLCDWR